MHLVHACLLRSSPDLYLIYILRRAQLLIEPAGACLASSADLTGLLTAQLAMCRDLHCSSQLTPTHSIMHLSDSAKKQGAPKHSSHPFWARILVSAMGGGALIEGLTSAAGAGRGAKSSCTGTAWPISAACQAAVGRYVSASLRWCLTWLRSCSARHSPLP